MIVLVTLSQMGTFHWILACILVGLSVGFADALFSDLFRLMRANRRRRRSLRTRLLGGRHGR